MRLSIAVVAPLLLGAAAPSPKMDSDTAAWWRTTAQLSNDGMEGRDTGTAAYLRAAKLVAAKFEAAGLKPFAACSVKVWGPPLPAGGVPVSVPVPSPLSVNVSQAGTVPVALRVAFGTPLVVTGKLPALPTTKLV